MIDIITTTYSGSWDRLIKYMPAVLNADADFKWYIWVNGADENIKKLLDSQENVYPIYNKDNSGSFSYNNNKAAAEGDGKYILLLNDDVEPLDQQWLSCMANVLEKDDRVGAVGSLLLYPDKELVQHCGVFFSRKTNNLPFHIHYRQPIKKVKRFIETPRYYQAVTGACMLVRREDWDSVGGLDEGYKYGYEDIDLCLKLKHQLNKRSVYIQQARLVHHEGISDFGKKESHPNLQHNIEVFRDKWTGKYIDDLDFYLRDPKFMVYRQR